ncbi:MAG TPA: NepR family anti-sigma factor [Alphaproteobacteria bacterium]|nr:NepR family anti-sigma factor [Alphaproteobacteria bacterium]
MAERSSVRKRKPATRPKRPDEKDPEFEPWLDGRLKAMYDTVLNEPLPEEILKLLNPPKRG